MAGREGEVTNVGPINFVGPATERVARVREDNDHQAVDLDIWRANIDAQHEDMSRADEEFFATLRKRAGA